MSTQEDLPAEEREVPPPDYLIPGIRCGLEMVIVGTIVALVGLPATEPLYLGIVIIATIVSMVVVLFWCLNRHIAEWIRRAEGKPTMADDADLGSL